MKSLSWTGALCTVSLFLFAPSLQAHGGQYRGPGDVVDPGRGGGGPPPTGPRPTGPTTGVPTGPSSGSVPAPTTPGTGPGSGPRGPGAPTTGTRALDLVDLTTWDFWWEFNKDPFLRLRDHLAQPTVSNSDDYFLGHARRADALDRMRLTDDDRRNVILPHLQRALASTNDTDIVSSCMVAIAKTGTFGIVDIVDLCAPHLRSDNQEVREVAALAIGIHARGDHRSIRLLSDLVLDAAEGRRACDRGQVDERTRSFAAYGLGLIASQTGDLAVQQTVADTLLGLLDDSRRASRDLRVAAVSAVSLLNPGSDAAGEALRNHVCDRLLAWFERDLGAGDRWMQAHVPTAIARLLGRRHARSADLTKRFAAILSANGKRERGNEVAQSCALALGQLALPDTPASAALVKASAGHTDVQTRCFALIAMGQIGGDANRNALLTALKTGAQEDRRSWAALALGVLAWQARQDGRGDAATIAEGIGRELQQKLQSTASPHALSALAVALGLSGWRDAAPELHDLLAKHGKQDSLAGYLCLGLAMMEDKTATEPIRDLVARSGRRPELLQQAAVALGRLGDNDVADVLIESLADAEGNLARLSAVARALSFVGDRRALRALTDTLADTSRSELVRAFAAVALGGIGAREPLPWNSKLSTNMNYRAAVETLTNQATGILDIL